MYVRRNYRLQGIARYLVNFAIEHARKSENDVLILRTLKHRIDACRFYEKLNFTRVGTFDTTFIPLLATLTNNVYMLDIKEK